MRVAARLLLLHMLQPLTSAVSMRELDRLGGGGGSPAPPAPPVLVQMNPLKGLAPLQKPHHSWGLPVAYLNGSSAGFVDGLMHDYIRITGSCSIGLTDMTETVVRSCVDICEAVAADRKRAGVAPPAIAINWSPWYDFFPGSDPTVTGAAEAKEMAHYVAKLAELQRYLGPANLKLVAAALIDEEKWDAGVGPAAMVAAATRKADLVYNATMAAFPGIRYEMCECKLSSWR
jgi:hypothetical protein